MYPIETLNVSIADGRDATCTEVVAMTGKDAIFALYFAVNDIVTAKIGDEGKWCYADEDGVRRTFENQGFVEPQIRIVKGDVLSRLLKKSLAWTGKM